MRGKILTLSCAFTLSIFVAAHSAGADGLTGVVSSASRATRAPQLRAPKPIRPRATLRRPDPSEIIVVKSGTFDGAESVSQPTATLMHNGNFFVAWQDWAEMAGQDKKGAAGYGMMFNPQMRQVGAKVIYTPTTLEYGLGYNKAMAFPDGNVLIAYEDVGDHGFGKYVVFNSQMRIIKGPVVFNDSETEFVDATRLAGGNAALIAYHRRQGAHGSGKLKIVNSKGEIFLPEQTFSPNGLTSNISVELLPDGLVYVMYNCGHTYTKILDPYGNIVRAEKRVPGRTFSTTKLCALNGGNVLAAPLTGECLLFNRAGDIVGDPHPFASERISHVRLTKLPDGHIFVSTIDDNEKVTCRIMNSQGKVVKGPKTLERTTSRNGAGFAQTGYPGNRVLLIFGSRNPGYVILQ